MRPEPGKHVTVEEFGQMPYLAVYLGYVMTIVGERYVIRPRGWNDQLHLVPPGSVTVADKPTAKANPK